MTAARQRLGRAAEDLVTRRLAAQGWRVVERNGKRLPEKDDQFTLTSQVQNREGWLLHPLDEVLRQQTGGKLRSLPVRLLFNDPSLNLRADYNLFDRSTGRPLCVGNGETCRRAGQNGIETLPCPGADTCRFAVVNFPRRLFVRPAPTHGEFS